MLILALVTLVLHAAIAGLFYTFSMSVIPGLNAIAPAQGEEAMRSINRKILNPWLYIPFLGAPLAALAAGLLAGAPAALWFFAGAAVNFVGSFLITMAINVPMNNALDAGTMAWKDYSRRWTAWNKLRAVASFVSLVLVGIGLTNGL
ncbi:anthrone oxygenase family protein [Nonomuraea sp. 3N208]|uniref:anthrone oxygenase family protein n=1 Tax=Nonomuraea sp. 3N208 TaxID=3457421 RepID=UPI003FCDB2C0